jgi:hypothetical protein
MGFDHLKRYVNNWDLCSVSNSCVSQFLCLEYIIQKPPLQKMVIIQKLNHLIIVFKVKSPGNCGGQFRRSNLSTESLASYCTLPTLSRSDRTVLEICTFTSSFTLLLYVSIVPKFSTRAWINLCFPSSDTCKLQHDALLNSGRFFVIDELRSLHLKWDFR